MLNGAAPAKPPDRRLCTAGHGGLSLGGTNEEEHECERCGEAMPDEDIKVKGGLVKDKNATPDIESRKTCAVCR